MEETEIFQADDGYWYYKNSRERVQGMGIASDLGNVGVELFLTKGITYLGKKQSKWLATMVQKLFETRSCRKRPLTSH